MTENLLTWHSLLAAIYCCESSERSPDLLPERHSNAPTSREPPRLARLELGPELLGHLRLFEGHDGQCLGFK
jgi:hypothetical protein